MGVSGGHPFVEAEASTVDYMDNQDEVREFLTSRRAKLSPHQVGLPTSGRRRVPGLRRSEVATLAGVSVEYYARIERSGLAGVSASVLHALARALQLNEAERAHLLLLSEAADGTNTLLRPRRSTAKAWTPPPTLHWVLESITAGPALVRNGRMDLLATNILGRAMHSPLYERTTAGVPNFARYTFLDDDSHNFYPDWEAAADISVSILRTEAGRAPHDRQLQDLVGELSTLSEPFRQRWSNHDVRLHGAGSKSFHHPVAGDLHLGYESADLLSESGLTLTIYAAEPGSPTAEALRLLASWALVEAAPTITAASSPL